MSAANTKIAAAVDEICRRAGGIWDDPNPETVRAVFEKHGLLIVLANPADAFPLNKEKQKR